MESSDSEHSDIFSFATGFVGGPHYIHMGGMAWFGTSIDITGLLVQMEDKRGTIHSLSLNFQFDTMFSRRLAYDDDHFPGIRPSIGVRIQTKYQNSQFLPFFAVRTGFLLWPYISPSHGDALSIASAMPHIPIGGGFEVPKRSPVRFRFSIYYTIPYGIPYRDWFGWLPIAFDIAIEFNASGGR